MLNSCKAATRDKDRALLQAESAMAVSNTTGLRYNYLLAGKEKQDSSIEPVAESIIWQ